MSRSNPVAKNPATRFMQWRGGFDGGGRLTWYDKEEQTEKDVELPFTFIVLDELATITGFNEKEQASFWSNEVRNLKKEELFVRSKSGLVDRGLYADIGDNIKAKGAKYAKSVYVAFKDETGELALGNIRFAGASLTAWIEFSKKFDVMQCAVILTNEPKQAKKGATKYWVPVFDAQNVSEATEKASKDLDNELQKYLSVYFNRQQDIDETVSAGDYEEDEPTEDQDEEQPEETPKAKPAPKKETEPKEEPKEKINLKDVPF